MVIREIGIAVSNKVKILPFVIEKVNLSEELEFYIQGTQWMDAFKGSFDESIKDLPEFINKLITSDAEDLSLSDICEYYKTELDLSSLQKFILIHESNFWNDEKELPSLLRRGVFILVGAWEGCELFDRLVAYKISSELKKFSIKSLVLTDRYWNEAKEKFNYENSPVITIGGPISNSYSNELVHKYNLHATPIFSGCIKGIKPVIGHVWGDNALNTLRAGKDFIDNDINSFIGKL